MYLPRLLAMTLLLLSACERQAGPNDITSAMSACGVTHGRIEVGDQPDKGQSDFRLDLGPSTATESQCINDRLEADGFEPIMILGEGPNANQG